MEQELTIERPLTKQAMLERLLFSKNKGVAKKAELLLEGDLTDTHKFGGFLTSVIEGRYKEALQKADIHNLQALEAKNFMVGRFLYISPSKWGYETGKKYYLKLQVIDGTFIAHPLNTIVTDILTYTTLALFNTHWRTI